MQKRTNDQLFVLVKRDQIQKLTDVLTGKEVMSIYTMALKIVDHFRLDRNLLTPVLSPALNEPAPRPSHTRFDLYKTEKELNLFPHPFEESLNIIEKQTHNKQKGI
ncbi:MAG: sugar nucleotide-binding protein [Bacteroidales bacterium]|nr:sugar nucleotide-binding protein [Bacteroidales bacterium]MBS3775265.1 sugar nucleotide-binding protein [Bacteroidales bacterium]